MLPCNPFQTNHTTYIGLVSRELTHRATVKRRKLCSTMVQGHSYSVDWGPGINGRHSCILQEKAVAN